MWGASYPVLCDLLDGTDGEDEYQGGEGGPASRGRHVGDLLQQGDEEEEAVWVAPKLLKQEAWHEAQGAEITNVLILRIRTQVE